jgi:Flp pilus assembly protein TadG
VKRSTLISRNSRRQLRLGTTLVEFAVVAPIFFLMSLGIIEFGRAMMVQALLTNAAAKGARAGCFDSSTSGNVTSAVNAYLLAGGISGATATCSPNPPSNALPGHDITVTVTIPYSKVTWLPAPRFLKNKTLSATALVQRETGT